jgi:S-layer protein
MSDTNTTFTTRLATATITDANATSIVITGNNGLALTHAGTALVTFDASGLTKGAVTFTAGALTTDSVIKGSVTGGDTLAFGSAVAKTTITATAGTNSLTGSSSIGSTITGGTGNDTIVGGTGIDTIRLADGVDLDLTQVSNQSSSLLQGGSRIDDVEIIDLGVQGANTLKLTLADVIDMSSANVFEATGRSQLLVKGTSGDNLDFADGAGTSGWTQAANVTIDTVVYDAWNHNTAFASVYVQSGIFVV